MAKARLFLVAAIVVFSWGWWRGRSRWSDAVPVPDVEEACDGDRLGAAEKAELVAGSGFLVAIGCFFSLQIMWWCSRIFVSDFDMGPLLHLRQVIALFIWIGLTIGVIGWTVSKLIQRSSRVADAVSSS